ncbi:MAG: substrate-binding domain-containing protein [Treponema sp.]|nr:substrate-binding domain-containing protein [Treponema sp.]
MKRAVRMSDIARRMGVSTVTVSKALGGKDGVSDALRKLISEKAAEMGYVYNCLPRNMRAGRGHLIGILISARYLGESSFYWFFYQTLLARLKETSYLGVLEIVSVEEEEKCVFPPFVVMNRVDGLIILGQMAERYIAAVASRINNCIFLDFYSETDGYDCVVSNNFLGSYNLTKLLVAAGHTRIGFIGSTSATTSILDRYMGFCKAMLEASLPYDAAIEDRDGNGVYTEIKLQPDAYTAYVCNNDQIAGIAITRLRELDIEVPRDVSIVGFDNESEAVTAGVGVTSLEVNVQDMCDTAVNLLIERIESKSYRLRGRLFIDGRVVIKESIAAPVQ